jgi:hypothetical protein
MKKTIIFLAILLLAISVRAMSPLTETDLSNVSNPPSLNTNYYNMRDVNHDSYNLKWNVYLDLDESNGETPETQKTSKRISFLSLLWFKSLFDDLQFYLIDPATGRSYTTIINTEDTHGYYIRPQVTDTPTMVYPIDYSHSTNGYYNYDIISGNIEMRDTYINNRSTTIHSGSWVNIKTH